MSLGLAIVIATALVCGTVLVITFVGVSLAKREGACPHCGASL